MAFKFIDWIPQTLGVRKLVMNGKFDVSPAVLLRILFLRDAVL